MVLSFLTRSVRKAKSEPLVASSHVNSSIAVGIKLTPEVDSSKKKSVDTIAAGISKASEAL
ncbi:Hypothetical predicted protein, partial [Olea europaea subsp. europaea]